jgi:outer membrane protein TolC
MKLLTHNQCLLLGFAATCMMMLAGCRTPAHHREAADTSAYGIVDAARQGISSTNESAFCVEPPAITLRRRLITMQGLPAHSRATLGASELTAPPHWPQTEPRGTETNLLAVHWTQTGGVELSLLDALQIAARNSRSYQTAKEDVFRTALDLDLSHNVFRSTFAGALDSELSSNNSGSERVAGSQSGLATSVSKTFQTGIALAGNVTVDLVKLLTGDRDSAWGLSADTTISIPLLRGAGRHITREPLTQAERNVVYAIHTLEEFKRSLAVSIADEFLGVMKAQDAAYNTQRNSETLATSAERASAMAEAGRLPEIQVDQTRQDQLRAYDRAVNARKAAAQALDQFKLTLGLPPDAAITLARDAFTKLLQEVAERSKQTADLPNEHDIIIAALANRLDLQSAVGRVEDAQRAVVVAADALRAEVSLFGSASVGDSRSLGNADQGNANLDLSDGILSGLLSIDLPFERTQERNAFRKRITDLEHAVRNAQEQEDSIKLQIRNGLRNIAESRESIATQLEAVRLAERRQHSTGLFLKAGRAEMRDLLEAEESLLSVRNALTAAIVNYRVAELRLQRDVGVLQVTDSGLTQEQPLVALNKPLAEADRNPLDNPGALDHD